MYNIKCLLDNERKRRSLGRTRGLLYLIFLFVFQQNYCQVDSSGISFDFSLRYRFEAREGMNAMNCGKQVFKWTQEGPLVAKPLDCVVGCTTCANLCQGEAITFPGVEGLRELYRTERLWAKVTKVIKPICLQIISNQDPGLLSLCTSCNLFKYITFKLTMPI